MTKEKKKSPPTKIDRKYPSKVLGAAARDCKEMPEGTEALEAMFDMSLEEFYYLNLIGKSPVLQGVFNIKRKRRKEVEHNGRDHLLDRCIWQEVQVLDLQDWYFV